MSKTFFASQTNTVSNTDDDEGSGDDELITGEKKFTVGLLTRSVQRVQVDILELTVTRMLFVYHRFMGVCLTQTKIGRLIKNNRPIG